MIAGALMYLVAFHQTPTYKDTSELVGIVCLWPRENLLVFETQIVSIDSDGIDSIDGWSKTHNVVKDVFGQTSTIDVRNIPRVDGTLWTKSTSVVAIADLLEKSNKANGELFPGARREDLSHLSNQGIGKLASPHRFFTTSWDEKRNRTTVSQLSSEKGVSPIILTFKGHVTPVYVQDRKHYIYIGEHNSRFGPLRVHVDGRERELISNAQIFIPLRSQGRNSH